MDEKALKTSLWQRIAIIIIAILLVGSMIFAYLIIVLGNSKNEVDESTIAEIQAEYDKKYQEVEDASAKLSEKYFETLKGYKSNVKAYNKAGAEAAGLETKDLKSGSGQELKEGDYNYYAYYIGWCSDGTIFDSSFDDNEKPTSLKIPLRSTENVIAGWKQGVIGMKIGGVRQITMNSDLAYGNTRQVCEGEEASPLKYIVLITDQDDTLEEKYTELQVLNYELNMLLQGGSGSLQ